MIAPPLKYLVIRIPNWSTGVPEAKLPLLNTIMWKLSKMLSPMINMKSVIMLQLKSKVVKMENTCVKKIKGIEFGAQSVRRGGSDNKNFFKKVKF